VSLSFDFPVAPWSSEYVAPLREMLASKNIPYSESPTRHSEAGAATGFITVANLDVSEAVSLVSVVFLDVFHCSSINVKVNGFGVEGRKDPSRGAPPTELKGVR